MKTVRMSASGDVITQMPGVLKWLKDLGFDRSCNSRYARYCQYISEFFASDMSGVTQDNFVNATRSLDECLDMVMIRNICAEEASDGFIQRLEKVISGPDFSATAEQRESRNYLLELVVAAKLIAAGYWVDFSCVTDVVAHRHGLTLYGECKRISSAAQFVKRFSKAGKQLSKELGDQSGHRYGLVFLDISDALPQRDIVQPVSDRDAADQVVQQAVDTFATDNMRRINELNDRFADSSLGVCLIARRHLWTEPVELFAVTRMSAITKPDLSRHRFRVLKLLLRGFDSGSSGVSPKQRRVYCL